MADFTLAPTLPSPGGFYVPETFTPVDAAKLRRELIEHHTSPLGVQLQELMCAQGRQVMMPEAPTYADAARILCGSEAARLAAARLYFIAAETVRLVAAAYEGYPDVPSLPSDPPSESGFVVFGSPLLARPVSVGDVAAQRLTARRAGVSEKGIGDPVYVVAASWGPFAPDNWANAPGIWVSFYACRSQIALTLEADTARRGGSAPMTARLTPENETAWQCMPAQLPPGKTEADYVLPDDRSGTAGWARALSCLWAMMRQEHIVASDPVQVPKTERKRHTREGYSDPRDVIVVNYRRHVREEEAEVNAALAAAGAPGGPRRGARAEGESWYKVRFPVSAHWRNQWYPSEGRHRLKRIPASWKGPADAPVKIRDRVELF